LAEKITELIDEINNNPEKIERIIQENRNKAEQEFNIKQMIKKQKIYINNIYLSQDINLESLLGSGV